jgi:hypothetical protein
MIRYLLFALFLLSITPVFSQKVFFRSAQTFSKEDMNDFYSSLAVEGDLVLFNANDYKIYAYHKDGAGAWTAAINRKSNTPPFFAGKNVWVTASINQIRYVQQLDTANGELVRKMDMETIYTKPVIQNGIMYATGISRGGCVFAYDLGADSLIWERFLAHGCSIKPYYRKDKIIANAEGNNWLEITYNGKLTDAGCEDSTVFYPSGLPCAKTFDALTHDGLEITGKKSEQWLDNDNYIKPIIGYSSRYTFILQDAQLVILGNKLKQKSRLQLSSLSDKIETGHDGLASILQADDEKIWIACSNQLLLYNHKNKKLEKSFDLSEWEPHQLELDQDKLWLISKKDGLLYGISLL